MSQNAFLSFFRIGAATSPVLTQLLPTLCPLQVNMQDVYCSACREIERLDMKYAHVDLLLAHRVRPGDIKVVGALGDSLTVSLYTGVSPEYF